MKLRKSALLLGVGLIALLVAASANYVSQSDVMHPETQSQWRSMHGAVSLVIYQNQDLALVEDERTLDLTRGVYELSLRGLSNRLVPGSVQIEAVEESDSLIVMEQRFYRGEADLWQLLRNNLGQEIDVFAEGGLGTYHGQLVGLDGGIILRDDLGQIHIIQDAARFTLLESELSEPTLVWKLSSELQGPVPVRLRYLSGGLNWWADFAAVLDAAGESLSLKSWVSLVNQTGLDFSMPQVQLISGQIHRAPMPERDYDLAAQAESAPLSKGVDVGQQEAFEYHEYLLPSPAALYDGQTAQVAFLQMDSIPFAKRYIYEASRFDSVQVWIEFENPAAKEMPLPGALVRIYQDSPSGLRFVGEDQISHTPVGETVRLLSGFAFDLLAQRTVLSQNRPEERSFREAVQVEMTNRKSEAVTIQVRERMNGDWAILESSHEFTKLDAATAEFVLAMNPNETRTIEYTVEYRY